MKKLIYANCGTSSLLAPYVKHSMNRYNTLESKVGGGNDKILLYKYYSKLYLKYCVAKMINALPEEITITQNTTEGINMLIRSDPKCQRILSCTSEHESIKKCLDNSLKRVDYINFSEYDYDTIDDFYKELSYKIDKYKYDWLVISRVAYASGLQVDFNKIYQICSPNGTKILIDAAQSFGNVYDNVQSLRCQAYSFTFGKWMGGPTGIGGIYIEKNINLKPCYSGWATDVDLRRFEVSTVNNSLVVGALSSLKDYTSNFAYKSEIRNHYLQKISKKVEDAGFITHYTAGCGLLYVYGDKNNIFKFQNYLKNNKVVIKMINDKCIRMSFSLQFKKYKKLGIVINEYNKNTRTANNR